ncbi:MAG: DUF349 domain-containing protein [Pseudomonadota bacterium]
MFSRWLRRGNRLKHADASIRLQALQSLSIEEAKQAQEQLLALAMQDDSIEVRKAAVQQVQQPTALAPLLQEADLNRVVAHRIATLLDSGFDAGASCAQHKDVVSARIAQADTAAIPGLIETVQAPEQLAELAVKLRDQAREHVLAHPVLQQEAGLHQLERTARGRDKFCNRYARERLEQIKQIRAACSQHLERVAELDQALHKALKQQPQGAEELIAHRLKLTKLGDMRAAEAAALNATTAELADRGGRIDDYAIAEDPLVGVDLFIPDPDNDPFGPLTDAMQNLSAAMQRGEDLSNISAQRDTLANNWLASADKFPPSKAQHQVFEAVSRQFHQYQQAWHRYQEINWADWLPPPPADGGHHHSSQTWHAQAQQLLNKLQWPQAHQLPPRVAELQQALQTVDAQLKADKQASNAALQAFEKDLAGAQQALADGQLQKATGHLKSARQHYKQIPASKQAEQTLSQLSTQLGELRDWQKFATTPKRQELLTALEEMCSNPAEPQQQAARLKALRQQWQQLGRPNNAEDAQLQTRFDELAEQAYEPCRDYYAQRDEARKANLQQRQAICAQLEEYLDNTDWAGADIKSAESILKTARSTWRQYHPCDRQALKPVEQQFEALQERLHGHIKAAWEQNVSIKKALCEEAKALLDKPLSEQINGAKQLQQQWRNIGPTPHGVDQRLWREFRTTCDAIFARRQADHEASVAQDNQAREQLQTAIDQLTDITRQRNPADASRRELDELNNTIDTASAAVKMNPAQKQQVKTAVLDYTAKLEAAKREQARAQLSQWQTWDAEISRAEQQGNLAELVKPDPIFAARLSGNAASEDWLTLTLTAEIAAGTSSPVAEQTQRMAVQVDLMNNGVRQFSAQDCEALLQRWCAAGPKDAVADALRERFFAALAAAQDSQSRDL